MTLAQQAEELIFTWSDAVVLPVSLMAMALMWLRYRDGSLAPWTPRRCVPWGALAMTPAIFLVVNVLTPTPENATVQETPFVTLALLDSVFKLTIVAMIVAVLLRTGATLRDLGVPTSLLQWYDDAKLGVLTMFACLAPIIVIQFSLIRGFNLPYHHPTLEAIGGSLTPDVLAAVTLSAVLAAPLFEEFVFRVLFQGAIERLEWVWLVVRRRRLELGEDAEEDLETEISEEAAKEASGEIAQQPTEASFGNLAFGWPSVLASSTVFCLVHLGQGPAPVALFPFACMLGWLYLRTHRITPGLFAHLALNLLVVAGTAVEAWVSQ